MSSGRHPEEPTREPTREMFDYERDISHYSRMFEAVVEFVEPGEKDGLTSPEGLDAVMRASLELHDAGNGLTENQIQDLIRITTQDAEGFKKELDELMPKDFNRGKD